MRDSRTGGAQDPINTAQEVNSNQALPNLGPIRDSRRGQEDRFPIRKGTLPRGLSMERTRERDTIMRLKDEEQPWGDEAFNAIVGGIASGLYTAVEDFSYMGQTVANLLQHG